jgi:hypothetical protein
VKWNLGMGSDSRISIVYICVAHWLALCKNVLTWAEWRHSW